MRTARFPKGLNGRATKLTLFRRSTDRVAGACFISPMINKYWIALYRFCKAFRKTCDIVRICVRLVKPRHRLSKIKYCILPCREGSAAGKVVHEENRKLNVGLGGQRQNETFFLK